MSNSASVTTSRGLEKNDLAIRARLESILGVVVTQATLSSVSVSVYDVSTGALVGTATPDVADVIYDTLQTPANWKADDTGYNFRHVLLGPTYFPKGGRTYAIEAQFTPTSGSPFHKTWEHTTVELRSA